MMYRRIFVDQCGYLPRMKKQASFCADEPVSFAVYSTCGVCVYTGIADQRIESASAGEINYIGDFSAITESGLYYIIAEGLGESDFFAVGENAFNEVFQSSVAFYYLQRCGHDLPESAAGIYAHKKCHTESARVYGSREMREAAGGWHDAGDYGRYVGPGAMAVAQLFYALERNAALCGRYRSPEHIGFAAASLTPSADHFAALPGDPTDYLDELKYELDWMMKMQREDGALYHKVSCPGFCGFLMPEDETEELVLCPVSVTATADFAAVTAMAVRFYKDRDEDYAGRLETASRGAYAAMKQMDIPGGFKNPEGITTGEYGDSCDADERYWAAAELYRTFGDDEYRRDFESLAREKLYHGYGWSNMGSYGNLAYLAAKHPVDEALCAEITQSMIALADVILQTAESDGYGTALTEMQYGWGSNLTASNNGLHLYDAWALTGERRYLDAAEAQLHYLLGRNPMGLCFVSGCGTCSIRHPHHRPSVVRGKAMPGMLSGGPCRWFADDTIKGVFSGKTVPAPAKCLLDMSGSYSTNEVTIYWNSSFLMLLASVASS